MSDWIKRRSAVAGVAVLVVALVAGCSGSSSKATSTTAPLRQPADASKVVLQSVEATTAAKSARVSLSVSSGSGSGAGISVKLSGVTDFESGDSQFTLVLGGLAGSLIHGNIEERSVNHIVYVQLPSLLGGSGPPGGQWLAVDASNLGTASSAVPGLGQSDPSQFLAYLETVSNGVQAVGSDKIRGVETTHYEAALNFGKAVDSAKVPAPVRAALKKLLESSAAGTPSTIPADVWLDARGRMRRLTLKIDVASLAGVTGAGALGSGLLTESIDLYDFGTPVSVQAPPASEVEQLPSSGELGSLGGGAIEKHTATAPA